MKVTSGIYSITNIKNSKTYIGSSTDLGARKRNHFSKLRRNVHPNPKLQASFNKHGEEAFVFQIIEECRVDQLAEREQYWFYIFSEFTEVYNIGHIVSSPRLGLKHSEETKARISSGNKGKTVSEEARRRIGAAHKGKFVSEETRLKLSVARKGKGLGPRKK